MPLSRGGRARTLRQTERRGNRGSSRFVCLELGLRHHRKDGGLSPSSSATQLISSPVVSAFRWFWLDSACRCSIADSLGPRRTNEKQVMHRPHMTPSRNRGDAREGPTSPGTRGVIMKWAPTKEMS